MRSNNWQVKIILENIEEDLTACEPVAMAKKSCWFFMCTWIAREGFSVVLYRNKSNEEPENEIKTLPEKCSSPLAPWDLASIHRWPLSPNHLCGSQRTKWQASQQWRLDELYRYKTVVMEWSSSSNQDFISKPHLGLKFKYFPVYSFPYQ